MLEMYPYDIKPEYNKTSFKKAISALSKGNKNKLFLKTVHARKDGSQYPVEVHLQLMKKDVMKFKVTFIVNPFQQMK